MGPPELSPYDEPRPTLRPIERELARLVARGATIEEAAELLNYSKHYLRTVARDVRAKAGGARTMTQAVAMLVSLGVIRPDEPDS